MSQPEQPDEPTAEKVKERTATIVRRLGYVVFMGGGLLIFIPMLFGVANGIQNDQIWDPFTKERVASDARDPECQRDAARLLVEAEELDRLEANWEARMSVWVDKCRADHPGMFDALRDTRQELRE